MALAGSGLKDLLKPDIKTAFEAMRDDVDPDSRDTAIENLAEALSVAIGNHVIDYILNNVEFALPIALLQAQVLPAPVTGAGVGAGGGVPGPVATSVTGVATVTVDTFSVPVAPTPALRFMK